MQEMESLKKFNGLKIEKLEQEAEELISKHGEQLRVLKLEHKDNLTMLKESHKEEMDFLREKHHKVIASIKESSLIEFSVLQDNSSYLTTLRQASGVLENLGEEFQTMKDDLITKTNNLQLEREMKLSQREKLVEDSEKRLKLNEESTEQERDRLMTLIGSLETQLSSLTNKNAEDNWIIRQKLASFQAEKDAFEREKTFVREQMTKDEKRIEDLKQSQLQEYQRLLQQVHDEKRIISIERTKLETQMQLSGEASDTTGKHEIEASVKVAKDAAKASESERIKYLRLQKDLERNRRGLNDRENELRSKEEELENEICAAKALETRAKEAISKYRQNEMALMEKMSFIQRKLSQIMEKEQQLSQERMTLSKERMDLNEAKQKIETSKCSLCRIGDGIGQISATREVENVPVKIDSFLDIDHLFDGNLEEALKRLKSGGDFSGFMDFNF